MLTKEKQRLLEQMKVSGKEPFRKEICKDCGGDCCKSYDISPFTAENIWYLLDQGYYSIRAFFEKDRAIAFLTAREVGQGPLAVLSSHSSCSHLNEDGCMFFDWERPTGGITLIPKRNWKCENIMSSEEIEEAWKNPAVVDVMAEVLKKYIMNHSLEKFALSLFKAFEYSVSNGTCSYNYITKYCIYHDGLRFGYKFKEGFDQLIRYS